MSAASKSAIDLGALHEVSRRHRAVSPLVNVSSASLAKAEPANQESEAEALIAILAEALEAIAEGTADAAARSIASEALVTFYGR